MQAMRCVDDDRSIHILQNMRMTRSPEGSSLSSGLALLRGGDARGIVRATSMMPAPCRGEASMWKQVAMLYGPPARLRRKAEER
jgi:hypothetical protein